MTMASSGHRQRKDGLSHASEEPPVPLGEATVGAQVRLAGKVTSEPTLTGPHGGQPAVLAFAELRRRTTSQVNHNEVWSKLLTEPFEICDEAGDVAVLDAREAETLLCDPITFERQGEVPDEMTPILGEAAQSLKTHLRSDGSDHEYYFEYVEAVLSQEQDVVLTGTVEGATEEPTAPAHYRDRPVRRRLEVQVQRITNLVGDALGRQIATGAAQLASGIVWVALAGASAYGYYVWFLARIPAASLGTARP